VRAILRPKRGRKNAKKAGWSKKYTFGAVTPSPIMKKRTPLEEHPGKKRGCSNSGRPGRGRRRRTQLEKKQRGKEGQARILRKKRAKRK